MKNVRTIPKDWLFIDACRNVVSEDYAAAGGYGKYCGVLLDATTAHVVIAVHDALSPVNQAKFDSMPFLKQVDIAWKLSKGKET